MQLDYVLTDVRSCVESMWHDQLIRIGFDRGCAQCVLLSGGLKPHLGNTRLNLKNWTPILHFDRPASLVQKCVNEMLQRTSILSREVLGTCPPESRQKYSTYKFYGAKTLSHSNHPKRSGTSATRFR